MGAGPKPEGTRGSKRERENYSKKTKERMRQAQSEPIRPKEKIRG